MLSAFRGVFSLLCDSLLFCLLFLFLCLSQSFATANAFSLSPHFSFSTLLDTLWCSMLLQIKIIIITLMVGTCSSINCINMPVVVLYGFVLLPCTLHMNMMRSHLGHSLHARSSKKKMYIVNLYTKSVYDHFKWFTITYGFVCALHRMKNDDSRNKIQRNKNERNEKTVSGPHTDLRLLTRNYNYQF